MSEISLTREKSEQEAHKILQLNMWLEMLDVEYLEAGLDEMQSAHSKRDSLAVLCPNPMTFSATQELSEAKIKQLRLIVELAKNVRVIREANRNLKKTEDIADDFRQIFQV